MTSEETNPAPASEPAAPEGLEMPAPTAWPIVLAFGLALLAAGMVTSLVFSAVGGILAAIGLSGWIRQMLPGGGEVRVELLPPERRPRPVPEHRGTVEELRVGMPGHRMHLPEKIHPYSAGVKGGIAGGIAMVVPALIYGVVSGHGFWFPINLLNGMVLNLPELSDGSLDLELLKRFHLGYFILATVIHLVISIGLGLMYGVLLPTLPGKPIFWGGVVAPLLWTGAAYSFMGVINPALRVEVDWLSFVAAQFVFGIVAGIVVVRSEKVYAQQAITGLARRLPRPSTMIRRRPPQEEQP
jgi:hypothetical protein